MRSDVITLKPIYSSFLSCDKDVLKILKTLFVSSKPHSDILKRLLIINNKDCLDTTRQDYQKIIDSFSLSKMIEEGYVRLNPKIERGTHEEIKSYILVSLDNLIPNSSSLHYLDYDIRFTIVCYNDAWVLNDYRIRALMICGYIDGILNSLTDNNKNLFNKDHQSSIKLSGIGNYNLVGCTYTNFNEDFSTYTLLYNGTHFTEDMEKIGDVNVK